MAHEPIENYGIVGDLGTVALVGMNGSVDFMCWPDFDSPSVFAALLDEERGGHFSIRPAKASKRHEQMYLPDTNVLLTRFLSAEGVGELLDFMPIASDADLKNVEGRALMRQVRCVRGEVQFEMCCAPRFDYARATHVAREEDGGVVFDPEGADAPPLRLSSDIPLGVSGMDAWSCFTLAEGESAAFVLADADGEALECDEHLCGARLEETLAYWRRWLGQSRYDGRWADMIHRSALTLKLLFSRRHGSLVAAPTFGLPETIGGMRNWDYRFTWLRDAAFTIYGLMRLGFNAEAASFVNWLASRCFDLLDVEAEEPLQPLYALDGSRETPEVELDHLRGYRGSVPVRIGNAAVDQFQLDIFGEIIDAIYLFDQHVRPISYELWRQVSKLADWTCRNWERPDVGIWEPRGERREFLHSRVMCWVAIDRALRMAWRGSRPAPLEEWLSQRDAIHASVHEDFWNEELGAFVQSKGSDALDASSLMMPMVLFIPATDPRWKRHMKALERELVTDTLVFRYRDESGELDGMDGIEGTFSMCSFWYVEMLARSGEVEKARFYLEKMLGFANHLGLYAEELGPCGEHLGNFPQAFTHLGLISAALAIDEALDRKGWVV